MNTAERNLRLAFLKALADAIADSLTDERADHLRLLVDRYDEEGTKSFDVRLPADETGERVKVATISLTVPKDRVDVDDEVLTKWAQTHGPTLLKTHHVPAVPAHTVPAVPAHDEVVLDQHAVAEFIKAMRPGPAGTVVDPSTGEVVDGLTHVPGGQPRSFSVRYATDGRDDLASAWRDGRLEHVLDDTPLPTIGGRS